MLNKNKQSGVTGIGWLIIIGIVLFFMYLGVKLVPAYMEFYSIKSSMVSVTEEVEANASKSRVRKLLGGRFTVNSIDVVKPSDAEFKDTTEGKVLSLTYEKKISLFGNVSALLDFHHEERL